MIGSYPKKEKIKKERPGRDTGTSIIKTINGSRFKSSPNDSDGSGDQFGLKYINGRNTRERYKKC